MTTHDPHREADPNRSGTGGSRPSGAVVLESVTKTYVRDSHEVHALSRISATTPAGRAGAWCFAVSVGNGAARCRPRWVSSSLSPSSSRRGGWSTPSTSFSTASSTRCSSRDGYPTSAALRGSVSSNLFDFGLHMRGRTLVLSAAAVVAVSALAQWPSARAVTSLDVARVVRERSS